MLHRIAFPVVSEWYQQRHSCFTIVLGCGIHLKDIQHLDGHASIQLTVQSLLALDYEALIVVFGPEHIAHLKVSRSSREGGSSDAGNVFGDGTDRLGVHRHECVLQEAGLLYNLPKYAASLMNKLTVST